MRTVKTPVKKTRSLRAAGESVKQEPAGNREEVLLQPHTTGLESGGFSRPEDVNYERTLNEALRVEALQTYLNEDLLIELWPRLRLPQRVLHAVAGPIPHNWRRVAKPRRPSGATVRTADRRLRQPA
jgi:hypothetical protein